MTETRDAGGAAEAGAGRAGGRSGDAPRGLATLALHGSGGRRQPTGAAHVTPLYQTTAFVFEDLAASRAAFEQGEGWVYTRQGNPTVRELERRIADLECHPGSDSAPDRETVDGCAFASGMAGLAAILLGVLEPGERVVAQTGIYGTSERLLRRSRRHGLRVDFVQVGDAAALGAAIERDPPPALVYVESPSNPLLRLTDLRAVARTTHGVGARLVVDATFATPAVCRPLALGADLVLHSTTKFLAGHGAALGGVVSGGREAVAALREARTTWGGAPDPFASWLTLLGVRTLPLRMERHARNAAALAAMLAERPDVTAVHLPDPRALPGAGLASCGPLTAFELRGGEPAVERFFGALRLATIAPTLGTHDTLVQHPWSMSHAAVPAARKREAGIGPGLVRVSVGLEDSGDLLRDFERALEG